jgi:hypothetical protein
MRKLRGSNVRTVLLTILVVAVFAPIMVHAKDYTVGVKAGDWVRYGQITVTWTGNGTEPSSVTDAKKIDWLRIDIVSAAGTTASLNLTAHYNNGTQTFQIIDADVQSGSMGFLYLVASNLTAGDPLSPYTPETTINQTVTRMYAGANRNVTTLDAIGSDQGEYKAYWDQNTGFMVETFSKQLDSDNPGAYEELSLKATETNLWSANALDLIQNNLIYIIAVVAVIVVIVAATIILRRRKPTAPQQPPPPPSGPPTPPS